MTTLTSHGRRRAALAVVLAGLLTILVWYSSAELASTPVDASSHTPQRPTAYPLPGGERPITVGDGSASPTASSSTFMPFLDIMPSSDGAELVVCASGVGELGGTVYANIGPGHDKHSWTMTFTTRIYCTPVYGFNPGEDVQSTVRITTTLGLDSGEVEFNRAFVETTSTELIIVDDGNFIVDMPNLGTFDTDVYVVVMPTNAPPPASLPAGYRLVGRTYGMRLSGALTESDRLMTLKLSYQSALPEHSDPHTLAVVRWPWGSPGWEVLGGDLFDNTDQVIYATKRFAVYGLASTPAWYDSFLESSLSGVSERVNTQWGPGDTIILATAATSGSVTSIPITPTAGAAAWGTLYFSATTSTETGLTVDVLDSNDTVVLEDAGAGSSLSGLSLATYPSLKLRATLTSTVSPQTPILREWRVTWTDPTLPPPLISAVSPISASNAATTPLTVSGICFTGTAQIRLGDSYTLPTTLVDAQTLIGSIPPGLSPGLYDVTVTNPDGQSAALPGSFELVEWVETEKVYLPVVLR